MNPEQFSKLLELLEKVVDRQYTLTGAADWPILVLIGGALVAMGAFMYLDLRAIVKEIKTDQSQHMISCKADCKAELKMLWDAFRDCQGDCCPREKK